MFNKVHWGNYAWGFIDSIALSYPINPSHDTQKEYKLFFDSLKYVLPCPKCRNHYKENLERFPLDEALKSRSNLIKWVIDIHNTINKSNGKRILSYEEAKKRMNGEFVLSYYHIITVIVVLTILVVLSLKLTK